MLKVVEQFLSSPILFWGSCFLILKYVEWVIKKLKAIEHHRAALRV